MRRYGLSMGLSRRPAISIRINLAKYVVPCLAKLIAAMHST
jgi:hypothetical protein